MFSQFGWLDVDTGARLWILGYVAAAILIGSALMVMLPSARWKFLAIGAVAVLITLAVTVIELAGGVRFSSSIHIGYLGAPWTTGRSSSTKGSGHTGTPALVYRPDGHRQCGRPLRKCAEVRGRSARIKSSSCLTPNGHLQAGGG